MKRWMFRGSWMVAIGMFAMGGAARADEIAVTIPTRGSVTESFTFESPAQPVAALVLLPGGEGFIGVSDKGGQAAVARPGNFLIRTRNMYVAAGMAIAALDVPSDQRGGIDEAFRESADNATDIAAVVAWLRQKVKAPVWLVGTSMGTISATNAAVRLGNKIDGLVLTSSVSAAGRRRGPSNGVLDLDLKAIAVPALVMASAHDACPVSPPGNADVIAQRMTQSPRKAVKFIEGGSEPKSDACQPFAYHGYYGVEDKAVAAIVEFVTAK